MNKSNALKRSAITGRFVAGPLGRGKAAKFAEVEGVTTCPKSATMLNTYSARGLKGDALRLAITNSFTTVKDK